MRDIGWCQRATYRKPPTATLMAMSPMTSLDQNWWQYNAVVKLMPLLTKNALQCYRKKVKCNIDCSNRTDTSCDRTLLQRTAQLRVGWRTVVDFVSQWLCCCCFLFFPEILLFLEEHKSQNMSNFCFKVPSDSIERVCYILLYAIM